MTSYSVIGHPLDICWLAYQIRTRTVFYLIGGLVILVLPLLTFSSWLSPLVLFLEDGGVPQGFVR